MLRDEVDFLMSELKAWAEQAEHGAQNELARLLGVPKQRVNHWITGRKIPNLLDGLKLQAFLKKQRRARSRAEALRSVMQPSNETICVEASPPGIGMPR